MNHQRIILISLFFFLFGQWGITQEETKDSVTVINQGIAFLEADWGEILSLAELEGKVIFLDAYTNWCRPCKVMDKEIFSRPDIGDFFNGHFLNVKMNMEEGEGKKLAEKYQILAYPTLLFINSDASVVHRFAGYKDVVGLLKLGREALDTDKNLASLKSQYESGNRTPEFLYEYLSTSVEAADGQHQAILNEYLATQEDWDRNDIRQLIFQLTDSHESPLFDYIIQNKSNFVNQFGKSKVEDKIQALIYYPLNKSEHPIAIVDDLFKKAYPDRAEKLAANYKMNYYRDKEDGKSFASAAFRYIKDNPTISEEELNDIAWNFYDFVQNQTEVKRLLKDMQQRAKINNTYLNNESMALLYAKLNKTKKALKLAQKAMTIAEKNKISSNSAEQLIEELKEVSSEIK